MSKQYINTAEQGAERKIKALQARGWAAVKIAGVTVIMGRPAVARDQARKQARMDKARGFELALEME